MTAKIYKFGQDAAVEATAAAASTVPSPVFEVKVDRYLEDLIPEYLNNRNKEVAELGQLLDAGDFDGLGKLAHRMIGVGTPYGFTHVTETARKLRAAALARDRDAFSVLLADYRYYVSRVRVVFE